MATGRLPNRRLGAMISAMSSIVIPAVAGVLAVFAFLNQFNSITVEAVHEYLQKGAKVIDVRTAEEYSAQHLPMAVNIPLDDLKERIGKVAPNKETVLLLHCQGGGRSGSGARVLKGMGYKNVFNLGSFEEAEKALAGSGK